MPICPRSACTAFIACDRPVTAGVPCLSRRILCPEDAQNRERPFHLNLARAFFFPLARVDDRQGAHIGCTCHVMSLPAGRTGAPRPPGHQDHRDTETTGTPRRPRPREGPRYRDLTLAPSRRNRLPDWQTRRRTKACLACQIVGGRSISASQSLGPRRGPTGCDKGLSGAGAEARRQNADR